MADPDRSSGVSDDIQRLVESLRSPGTPSELGSESLSVDALVSALTTKETPMTPRLTGKARVASFIAAGIIGFGGVAAAGPKVLDLTSDESPSIQEAEQEKVDGKGFVSSHAVWDLTPERAFGVIETDEDFARRATKWVW